MKRFIDKSTLGLAVMLFITACGGATSSSSTSQTAASAEVENTAAAALSLFSNIGASAADTQNLASRFTINSTGADLCDPDNMENAPTGVFMSTRGGISAYPFGSATDPMTISSTAHYCVDESGTANTGTGPDGQGLFATFIFIGEPEGSCDDGSSFSFAKGSGIARNTQEYYPEIFGRFEIEEDLLNCTLRLRENGTIDLDHSSCTDDNGTAISLDTTVTCSIDADIQPIEDPEFYKGHYGLGEDADRNLNYDCVNYGFEQGDDHISRISNDCSALTDVGFNIEFLSIGTAVTDTSQNGDFSSWSIAFSGTSHEELRPQIQLLHAAGLQVALGVDVLYYPDPENPNDDTDFPAVLIDNTDFHDDLAEFIMEQAAFAEETGAELFIPLSESDRIFSLASSDDDEFLAGIIDDVVAAYSGKLAYVWSYDLSEHTAANLAAFDLIGFNRSPQGHNHLDTNCSGSGTLSNCLEVVLETNFADQEAVVNDVNGNHGGHLRQYVDSLGVWGNGAETEPDLNNEGEVDWMDDATVAAMFTSAFELARTYDTAGLVAWEGVSSEFVFPGQTQTLDALTQGFLGF